MTRPTTSLDPLALDLARQQHGVLTTAQLTATGLSAPTLVDLVGRGVLEHPGRGLYLVAETAATERRARLRQLVAGAFLLYPDAVLTGSSALMAHDVPLWGADLRRPAVLRPVGRSGGSGLVWVRPLRVGRSLGSSPWGPSVEMADALVQLAMDDGMAPGVVAMDAALRSGQVTREDLDQMVAAVQTWPHATRAVAAVRHCDGRRESVGESRCALDLAVAGIVATPQVDVRDDDGELVGRVDFLVEGTHVIVEFDGKVKYGSGDPAVLWAEKRREDRLRRLGYVVVRVTWADLEHPGRVAARVRAAIVAA
ncbi:type IV toxin-antitoxin system AbiEi family antitoxin domain-containing protein [Phycicoccus flavus]|uniref:AbiEi antitoxin N-terminal domain-containing protein n=1 Tax=Phycicoccus flavus TaxID=2502783 RepID=A0A8T6QZK3_9MICO|nr:type IV toxin-antitoxin system AbiEi family antitoxin domain-containing protein [Phycicoccus flavus]NHA66674.1 hypothetical protein [Phycicoccus flavus]